jgi:hypothetical protein
MSFKMRKKQSRGNCIYCGHQMTKVGMAKHLQSCDKRKTTISDAAVSDNSEIFYHLQIQEAWQGTFWLHLEMSGEATLEDLDDYLRAIWLECCGHMSQFSFQAWKNEVPMNTKAKQIFKQNLELTHIYDFGTSSETKIKVVSLRKGQTTSTHPIVLMARNEPPEAFCIECGKRASWLCVECLYEYDQDGTLCDQHAETHPHDNYGEPISLVNSPRVGMCGYDGPAEPPY